MKKAQKSRIVRIALLVFGIYIAYLLVSYQVDIAKHRRELAALQEEYQEQLVENEQLQRTLDSYGTEEFIERMAREKLGYAYGDEHFYVDVSGTK